MKARATLKTNPAWWLICGFFLWMKGPLWFPYWLKEFTMPFLATVFSVVIFLVARRILRLYPPV